VILLGAPEALAGIGRGWKELDESPVRVRVHVVQSAGELERLRGALGADLIIDAILERIKPPMKGMAARCSCLAGLSRTPVLGSRSAFRLAC